MLVLTRKVGEKIFINNDKIEVTVLSVKGNQVRISIKAPQEVSVYREEVYQRMQAEKDESKKALL